MEKDALELLFAEHELDLAHRQQFGPQLRNQLKAQGNSVVEQYV